MSKKANPAAIGLFVIVATVIALGAVLVLGSGRLFNQSVKYVLYFEGDLNGLDVGSPVTTRGVKVGQVTSVSIVYDHATRTISTPVEIEITPSSFVEVNREGEPMDGSAIDVHIERGLRAQLETLSLVTGMLRINLDYFPDTQVVMHPGESEYPEIPTIPTTLQRLADKLGALPIHEIILDLQKSMASVSAFFESGSIDKTFQELNETLAGISTVVESADLREVLASIDDTLNSAKSLMVNMDEGARPVQRELVLALKEFSDAARSAHNLLNYLERHPEAFIQGKGNE